MPDVRFPFHFYDPTTDVRLAPSEAELLILHTRIPFALLHTVHQAKELIGELSIDSIIAIAGTINKLDTEASFLRIGRMQAENKTYSYADAAENLRLVLGNGSHDIPPHEWPIYMGVLALSLAGQIHNEIWPTDEYQKIAAAESGTESFRPVSDTQLQQLTTVATKAAAYGEAFRDILAADAKHRETNRKNASKAHQHKHDIINKFIAWTLNLPQPNQFASSIAAAEHFRTHHLTPEEKRHAAAHTFLRTLSEKLKAHVEQHKIPHPIQKK